MKNKTEKLLCDCGYAPDKNNICTACGLEKPRKKQQLTLIKTNNSLILVSDEKIKEGDLCIWLDNLTCTFYADNMNLINESYRSRGEISKVLSQSPKLSKEVADEIGWIDVEELAYNRAFNKYPAQNQAEYIRENHLKTRKIFSSGYIEGFQKAQELNQKKYSKDDLKPLQELLNEGYDAYDTAHHLQVQRMLKVIESVINSSQPQQWQVEVEEIDGVRYVNKILE